MEIFSWIIVGLIAGWLAGRFMRGGGFGVWGDMIIGMVAGSISGWFATSILHVNAGASAINLGSMLLAFTGAVALLVLLRVIGIGRRSLIP
jgi:uncharacterized membrane protein YeaQ/YmgE (transglycosylase-associated protein family)